MNLNSRSRDKKVIGGKRTGVGMNTDCDKSLLHLNLNIAIPVFNKTNGRLIRGEDCYAVRRTY